jgi:hypothetical protein
MIGRIVLQKIKLRIEMKGQRLKQIDAIHYLKIFLISISCNVAVVADLHAQVLTLPMDQRPAWLKKEGLVMAGSWEPLTYRTRQGTLNGHVPTAEERALWEREHSPEVTQKMKGPGRQFHYDALLQRRWFEC